MKFAAIDIGSNATRLLFCNVLLEEGKEPVFKKAELIRVPLRLGEDAFVRNKIGREKTERLITAMKAFKHLIKVYDAVDYRIENLYCNNYDYIVADSYLQNNWYIVYSMPAFADIQRLMFLLP